MMFDEQLVPGIELVTNQANPMHDPLLNKCFEVQKTVQGTMLKRSAPFVIPEFYLECRLLDSDGMRAMQGTVRYKLIQDVSLSYENTALHMKTQWRALNSDKTSSLVWM